MTQKINFPILPEELLDFLSKQGERQPEELARAEELIESNPLPSTILRKMVQYEDMNQKVEEKLKQLYRLQSIARDLFYNGKPAGEIVDMIDERLGEGISSVTPEEARVLVKPRMDDRLQFFNKLLDGEFYHQTERHLVFPHSFDEAYVKAVTGERMVEIALTVGDRHKARESPSEFSTGYKGVVLIN